MPTVKFLLQKDFKILEAKMLEEVKCEKLLRAEDVAQRLNISRPLAYRLIQQRQIPSVMVNGSVRVKAVDLEEYIRRHYRGWSETREY